MKEEIVALGDVAYEPVDQSGPSGISSFIYVDIGSIDREKKTIVGAKPLTVSNAPSRAKQVLRAGDILVSMTRPNLNAVAIVPQELDCAIASTGFQILRSKWLEPKFLYYLVQTQRFIDEMCVDVQGALNPAIRPKDIFSFNFFLPSSLAQTRIVEKLEELLSDLDAGVAELKAAQKKLAQYRQSLLKAAVEGELTAAWRVQKAVHPELVEGRVLSVHASTGSARTGETETGAQLLDRILAERRRRWEEKQLAKFKEQGKTPPQDWQDKYPEPVKPDITNLPELPDSWVWASVDQCALDETAITDGPFGSNLKSEHYQVNGPQVIRLQNIGEGVFVDSRAHISQEHYAHLTKHSVSTGDLVVAML